MTIPFNSPRALTLAVAALGALALAPSDAAAQSEARTLTVLGFSASGDVGSLATDFYNVLRTQVELHPGYALADVPPQTLDDLLLAVGCIELDATCSATIREVVGTDLLAWGELTSVSGQFSSRLTLWDLVSGEPVRVRTQSIGGGPSAAVQLLPLLARGVLYGDEGSIHATSTPEGAQLFINEEASCMTPCDADALPLGAYAVRMVAPDGTTREETVLVDVGGSEVDWRFDVAPAPGDEAEDGGSQISPVLGWAAVGTGGALLLGGVLMGLAEVHTQNQFDDEAGGDNPEWDPSRAHDLADKGRSQALASNILLGTGAVVAGAGAVLVVLAMHSQAEADESGDASAVRLSPWGGPGSFGLVVNGRF